VSPRQANVSRNTFETDINCVLNIDGQGRGNLQSGVPFLDHMLDQIVRHGLFDIAVKCDGDNQIDDHHSVEDIGIALGMAFDQALGDRKGIQRYGHAYVPLDEALSRVVIDFSGRPGLYFHADFARDKVGTFDVELTSEFFQGFASHAKATIHMDVIRGTNEHHKIETLFKAFGRSLRMACSVDDRAAHLLPSTKGAL